MKNIWIYTCFLFCIISTVSAQKHDYNWVISDVSENPPPFGSSYLSFDKNKPNFLPIVSPISISLTGTTMSDSLGELLFFTNGLDIINKEGNLMENGSGLNPGDFRYDDGYFSLQGAFALPTPEKKDEYFLFHLSIDYNDSLSLVPHEVLYTKIDMSANGGLGRVTEKNIPIMGRKNPPGDTLFDVFAATRHGNGRDWWVLLPDKVEDRVFRFLLTPNGIEYKDSQEVPIQPDFGFLSSGQNIFSPDGNIYVIHDLNGLLHIFDFDRCTGELFNQRTLKIDGRPHVSAHGTAISPNSRFLYYSESIYVIQLDLEKENLYLGLDTIGVLDYYQSPFINVLTFMQLTPDGRIFIRPANETLNWHTIEAPNKKGKACQLMLHQVQAPNYAVFHIPYYPNYRLYDLPDSPCDTLGINNPH